MAFKVITKKINNGSYTLSYGRGEKKITARTWYNDLEELWLVDIPSSPDDIRPGAPTLEELKSKWERWAVLEYCPQKKFRPSPPTLQTSGPPPSPLRYKDRVTPHLLLEMLNYANEKFQYESPAYREARTSLNSNLPKAIEYLGYLDRKAIRQSRQKSKDRPVPNFLQA